jgi:anti-sigma regulatory factor (Ser/Thr protein kinase)
MYEGEINMVIHGGGGVAEVEISENQITINLTDEGPGIADINLAMKEGFSTASDTVREMGFGAGMGLPNIKKQSDNFSLTSEVGKGTALIIELKVES